MKAIRAAVILHNMMIDRGDYWDEALDEWRIERMFGSLVQEIRPQEEPMDDEGINGERARAVRNALRRYCHENFRLSNGYLRQQS